MTESRLSNVIKSVCKCYNSQEETAVITSFADCRTTATANEVILRILLPGWAIHVLIVRSTPHFWDQRGAFYEYGEVVVSVCDSAFGLVVPLLLNSKSKKCILLDLLRALSLGLQMLRFCYTLPWSWTIRLRCSFILMTCNFIARDEDLRFFRCRWGWFSIQFVWLCRGLLQLTKKALTSFCFIWLLISKLDSLSSMANSGTKIHAPRNNPESLIEHITKLKSRHSLSRTQSPTSPPDSPTLPPKRKTTSTPLQSCLAQCLAHLCGGRLSDNIHQYQASITILPSSKGPLHSWAQLLKSTSFSIRLSYYSN